MRRLLFKIDGKELAVRAETSATSLNAELDGQGNVTGDFVRTGPNSGIWTVNGTRRRVAAVHSGSATWAAVDGRVYRFELIDPDEPQGASLAENAVAAPMPGKVVKVFKGVGDAVEEGEPVIIVEAMKMEHTLRAPKGGTISELGCSEGDQVESGVPLLEIEASE